MIDNDYPETFPPLFSVGLMTRHAENNEYAWAAWLFVAGDTGELRLVYSRMRNDLIIREQTHHPRSGVQVEYEVTQ